MNGGTSVDGLVNVLLDIIVALLDSVVVLLDSVLGLGGTGLLVREMDGLLFLETCAPLFLETNSLSALVEIPP